MTATQDAETTAAEFGTLFVERSFADATDLLADGGGDAVVDAFPDAFTEESTTAADALEAYWWGLYGQYGDPEGVDVGAAPDDGDDGTQAAVALEFAFADGTATATVEVAEDGARGSRSTPRTRCRRTSTRTRSSSATRPSTPATSTSMAS